MRMRLALSKPLDSACVESGSSGEHSRGDGGEDGQDQRVPRIVLWPGVCRDGLAEVSDQTGGSLFEPVGLLADEVDRRRRDRPAPEKSAGGAAAGCSVWTEALGFWVGGVEPEYVAVGL